MNVDAILSQLAVELLALLVLIQLIITALHRIARRQRVFRLPVDVGDDASHSLVADAHGSPRG
jgi:hypothetical protein